MKFKKGSICFITTDDNPHRKYGVTKGTLVRIKRVLRNDEYDYLCEYITKNPELLEYNDAGPFHKHSDLEIVGNPLVIKILYGTK